MKKPPIFIGGTGRSGTTVMAKFISSHVDYCIPSHENKLIAGRGGLRSLEEYFMQAPFEYSGHKAIKEFIDLTKTLRDRGIKRPMPRFIFKSAKYLSRFTPGKEITERDFMNIFPATEFSISSVGSGFGLAHYDNCIHDFIGELVEEIDIVGAFGQRGFTRPLYVANDLDHETFLYLARCFLDQLYETPVKLAGAKGWCDDSPLNVTYTDFLLRLYPEAKIIHMIRHPIDVLNSWQEQIWTSNRFERGVKRLVRDYRKLIQVTDRHEGTSLMTFKIEDLAQSFTKAKSELCRFCDISESGFNGSVKFTDKQHGRWKERLSEDLERYALDNLGFAIEYFDYNTS